MRFLKLLVLYAGVAFGANAASAETSFNAGALIALAEGDLAKIRFHAEPRLVPQTVFQDANGGAVTLAKYRGKHVVLNFWALWCAPCVREMPALNRLDAALGGASFEVVTIATGRNARPAVDKFFKEKQLTSLPKLFDPKMKFAREIGARGLPVTILIGPDGREIGRMEGEAHWDSPAAKNLMRAWMAGS